MRILIALLALGLAACASKPEPKPQPKPEPRPEPQAEVTLDAPLVYKAADGTDLGIPMVEASVRDGKGLFIVNSASTHNVLTRSFATRVRAPVLESRRVGSSSGAQAEVLPVQGVVAFKFAGTELREENVISFEHPNSDAQGIAGYLAPHLVGADYPIVLDFAGKSMKVVEGPEHKIKAWLESEYPGLEDIGSYGADGRPYATAKIGERADVKVRLDTGGPTTQFEAAYVSRDGETKVTPVEFAGVSFPIEAVSVEDVDDDDTAVFGTLGADILQSCTIVFWKAQDRVAVACQ